MGAVRKTVAGDPTVLPSITDLDPETANALSEAITDFRNHVIEIRRRSTALFDLTDADARAAEQAVIDDLAGEMAARCDRLDITLDDLFRLINEQLRTTPGGDPHRPSGDYERALLDENTRAHGAERQALRGRERLLERHAAEVASSDRYIARSADDRLAADRAHAGYFAGWARRGDHAAAGHTACTRGGRRS
jgi:hypothetical protein